MANRVITVVLVLLVVVCGGTGYYAYSLSRQLEELDRNLNRTAAELAAGQAAGNAALAEKIEELDAAAGGRLDALEDSAADARNEIGGLEEQLAGLETRLGGWESRTGELEASLDKAITDFSRTTPDTAAVYDRIKTATVRISNGQDVIGSGFIYDDEAHVVTAQHVTAGRSSVWVILHDGRAIRADLLGSSEPSDIAVLQLKEDPGIAPPVLADSGLLRVGEAVISLGSPGAGDGISLRDTLSNGIVSQVNRLVEIEGSSVANIIQSDVAVNPGNSGGPLYNADAEVVGLTIARISAEVGDGISFAVAANKMRRVADAIVDHGSFDYPWLGVGILDITPQMMQSRGYADTNGVLVTKVYTGPSMEAGIEPDDVILALDDAQIRNIADLACYLGEFKSPGDTAGVTLRRDGNTLYLEVEVGKR